MFFETSDNTTKMVYYFKYETSIYEIPKTKARHKTWHCFG